MDVSKIRTQIPVCSNLTYLNTGWSGPSPQPVIDAIKARVEYEAAEGPTSKPVRESVQVIEDDTRQAAADLLNITSDELCLTQNTTEGLNIVMAGFPWQEGDEIITFDIEHLSVMIPCLYAEKRHGVKVAGSGAWHQRRLGHHTEQNRGSDKLPHPNDRLQPHPVLLWPSHAP